MMSEASLSDLLAIYKQAADPSLFHSLKYCKAASVGPCFQASSIDASRKTQKVSSHQEDVQYSQAAAHHTTCSGDLSTQKHRLPLKLRQAKLREPELIWTIRFEAQGKFIILVWLYADNRIWMSIVALIFREVKECSLRGQLIQFYQSRSPINHRERSNNGLRINLFSTYMKHGWE
ncbi:hypothetical protein NC653_018142 [Populus alba x Populus x berolinensis]|uniref:Uncharacterized protein n=1 Tax=Populus alba x Populus x berolinensis TaxID=444605 RepID=A0AAD6W247_9ROSI|nr:hypothetical protein NC653_018142 [Populus alba x Populus x berolinensis]